MHRIVAESSGSKLGLTRWGGNVRTAQSWLRRPPAEASRRRDMRWQTRARA